LQSISTAADTTALNRRIAAVQQVIRDAAVAANRPPDDITLIAASKTRNASTIRAAAAAGVMHFGENYLQEALDKITTCADLSLTWHFIGAIQTNKTRALAENFHWVHTVDRPKIARRLNDQCPHDKLLNICLQINIDRDQNKAGVMVEEAADLLEATLSFPKLQVRGLMTILHPDSNPADGYKRLADLFSELSPSAGSHWDSLSMGMSGDIADAIGAGATHVRVGTAIFGPRQAPDFDQTQQPQ
jgi:PLP dependent protein